MSKYLTFSKKKFEFYLTQIKQKNNLLNWRCINGEKELLSEEVKEYVYEYGAPSKAFIRIYSSLDISCDEAREKGIDAVRIVFRWNTKNGMKYSRIKKLLRVEKLFENIEKTVGLAYGEIREEKLNQRDWTFNLEEVL